MIPHPFLNQQRRLRSGWWIAIFFAVLAALLFPLLFYSRSQGGDVPIYQQAGIVLAASIICQALRRRPMAEMFGAIGWPWARQLLLGALAGALLMAVPALLLGVTGAASWTSSAGLAAVLPVIATSAAVAITEEVLFRGFLFQRFIDGLGAWPAQITIAALFTLTHSSAIGQQGALGYLAAANIFLASIMFGLAYLRTRGLAAPIGLHFAANATQGPLLGFGVSGGQDPSLLAPVFHGAPDWVTGGSFGLEASVPSLLCVLALVLVLLKAQVAAEPAQ